VPGGAPWIWSSGDFPRFRSLNWRARLPNATVLIPVGRLPRSLRADDAIELISDGLEIEAVIQALVDLFRERVPEEAWPGT